MREKCHGRVHVSLNQDFLLLEGEKKRILVLDTQTWSLRAGRLTPAEAARKARAFAV